MPLQQAIWYYTPLEIVDVLLKSWPDAAKEKDSDGNTPLHIACMEGAQLKAVAALLQAWPDAAKEKTRMTLHLFILH
eukprot:2590169-Ditylum_brightwellii.AAC.1